MQKHEPQCCANRWVRRWYGLNGNRTSIATRVVTAMQKVMACLTLQGIASSSCSPQYEGLSSSVLRLDSLDRALARMHRTSVAPKFSMAVSLFPARAPRGQPPSSQRGQLAGMRPAAHVR